LILSSTKHLQTYQNAGLSQVLFLLINQRHVFWSDGGWELGAVISIGLPEAKKQGRKQDSAACEQEAPGSGQLDASLKSFSYRLITQADLLAANQS
jgi:hypothetical protein